MGRSDDRVAVEVMGWKLSEATRWWEGKDAPPLLSSYPPAPQYSMCDNTYFFPTKKVDDTWKVIEKMKELGYYVAIQCCHAPKSPWCVIISNERDAWEAKGDFCGASCRAALKAVRREKELKGRKKR